MKQVFALLLAVICERSMAHNQTQVAAIEKSLDYEMRHVSLLKMTTREAIRENAVAMIGAHWESYQKWQARLNKVKTWANS